VECYNCHRKEHFARECKSRRNQGRRSYGDNGRSNAPTNESSSQALVDQDGLGGYDWSNDFKVEPVNYALMAISSSTLSCSSDNAERYELKLKTEKWEESSKNLSELLNNQMSAKDKTGLGYGTQLNEMSLDEFAIRKKIIESQTTELNTESSEPKTSEVNIEKPKSVVSTPNINREKVIIEDWNSDDVSEVSPVKTKETQTVKIQVDIIGQTSKKVGIGFKKTKAYFVCKSTDHLIKDCDFYDKKSLEPKLTTVVKSGQRVVKPVWDNAKRVNDQKNSNKLTYPHIRKTFVSFGILTKTGLINTVRPNEKRAVHNFSTARPVSTAKSFALKIAQIDSAIRPIYPRMDNVRPRASCSSVFRPKELKQDVKTSGVQNITTTGIRAVVNTGKDSGSFMLKKFEYVNPKGISKSDHAVVDSGCSSHMTGNKAYLSDYEDFNGCFVAFGSDPKGEGSGGNHGGQSSSDRSLLGNEDGLTLQSVYDLCISL
ncbi:ribonuclease H-like domain-containing protein, partial [Tanacetum coccineum]